MRRRFLRSVEECYRGRSVRVFRIDRARVINSLRQRARAVLERRPDVVEVRLFGSLACDQARPGSDADLFVVVDDTALPFLERIADIAREFGGVGIGCDVIVFTESETRALRNRGDAFARAVFGEGLSLASRESSAS
jgi:predicted nucleotidyltransferase